MALAASAYVPLVYVASQTPYHAPPTPTPIIVVSTYYDDSTYASELFDPWLGSSMCGGYPC